MMEYIVTHLGCEFCRAIGLIIMIGPYLYHLIRSIEARMKYTKEDINKMMDEEAEQDGISRNKLVLLLMIQIVLVMGGIVISILIGGWMCSKTNEIIGHYMEMGMYLKKWPWG